MFWRAGHGSPAVWGMNCLRSLGSRDCGFESHTRHGCLVCACVYVVLCLCRGFATSWSLVQGVLPSVKWSWNWKSEARTQGSCWTSKKKMFRRSQLHVKSLCVLELWSVSTQKELRDNPVRHSEGVVRSLSSGLCSHKTTNTVHVPQPSIPLCRRVRKAAGIETDVCFIWLWFIEGARSIAQIVWCRVING
jgi:hypothetical protein